ncbi:hypothetical protein EsH8_IX_000040 [Colletotrichum jinshuiense]
MPKVWFITGSSRGLGRSLAEFALENGDFVAATARDIDALRPLVEKYGPDKLLPVALDVTSWESVQDAVNAAAEAFGRIDLVVNNAGYANISSVEDVDVEDFRRQVDTNLFGVVHVSKAVLPVLRRQKSGHIFQISSVGGRVATPGLTAYQCSKWAVGGFSTGLAAEVGPLGIRVTVLEPGGMRTDWAGSSMIVHPSSEPYQQTVGTFSKYLRDSAGKEPTDPASLGPMIEELYKAGDPPLRMLVGPDAVEYWAAAVKAQAESDEKWKRLSLASITN